jgi:tellurite resistance protein TerC
MTTSFVAAEQAATGADPAFSMPVWGWAAFVGFIVALLLVDLLVVHRDAHVVSAREAATWSAIWIGLGLLFAGAVYLLYGDQGGQAAQLYLSGFLIEKSLSVDNLFVFVIIFSYFRVPDAYQHRVLFWGILGALVFRGIFIALGAVLLAQFSWVAYLFGAFLVYTGWKLGTQDEIEVHPEDNPILKAFKRTGRITADYDGQKLLTRIDGVLYATPLFAVLLVVESTDVVFAVDSIPAIFGVTRDPFLVFSSNAFALLGLRALYFLLADAVRRFRYLDKGVAFILVLVGVKLIVEEAFHESLHIPAWVPLLGIAIILGGAVWMSLRHRDLELDEDTGPVEAERAGPPKDPDLDLERQD